MNEFLTIREVSQILKVSRTTIYRYFKLGLKFHKIGGSIRIKREDLEKFIKGNKI